MEYNFRHIEQKWQQKWIAEGAYKVPDNVDKPKYYVLDMFPYPSGAGLHVGHPLGYIASDIYARYKRLKGYNVLHPMGYDAFGLPAEQYAIEHGVHPAASTAQNIQNFRSQLDKIGFSFDWSREVNTSNPHYYKWTQWIFLQLFKSWYNRKNNKTEPIDELIKIFESEGNISHPIPDSQFQIEAVGRNTFTADEWKSFDEKTQQTILMEYRIAYCGYGEVNWCEALGTVLANDEVINGVSERGGYPVVKKKLRQWYLRITEYADRLLEGLQRVDFSEAMKEMQSNWIGKSSGAEIRFNLTPALSTSGEGGGKGAANVPKYKIVDKRQYEDARQMRKESTEAENVLWQHLRNNQLGAKFRRQHPIDSFIADFVCLQKKIIVEVDGSYHNDSSQKIVDEERTLILSDIGFKVIRFTNQEVLHNITSVITQIKNELTAPENIPLSTRGEGPGVRCYTTRPDTIFGVDFMVLAPEHELVASIITVEQKKAVEEYIAYVKSRSERERMAEKKISGVFTGAYAVHPFTGKPLPVWISEYVLAGYGTGAIMAVPSGDERDHKFAQYFNLPITNIFGDAYNGEEAVTSKDVVLHNSDFLDGLTYKEAIEIVINELEEEGIGKRKVNYKMRDAAFSRQRYWGEPFPIKWIDGIAYPLPESELPLELPHVESYQPGPEGEGPLANIPEWVAQHLEANTMPGYAGSSWYFLRYMDPHNDQEFCNRKISDYWNQVDLYVGGTEHAVGHLLYSRMWVKALYDLNLIGFDEPYKKLLNQGMITGMSQFIYRYKKNEHPESQFFGDKIPFSNVNISDPNYQKTKVKTSEGEGEIGEVFEYYFSADFIPDGEENKFIKIHVPVDCVENFKLDIDYLRTKSDRYEIAVFVCKNGYYKRGKWYEKKSNGKEIQPLDFKTTMMVEKMSKSKLNVENPNIVVEKYGADTFRMYEMFLGPVEMSKPWDTKGIEGVHRFLKKLWRLFWDENGAIVTNETPTPEELKTLHKTIKKIEEDTERFSFNTAVSAFMVCVNELTDLKCHKKDILLPLIILLTPYAPHISAELWERFKVPPQRDLGGASPSSVLDAPFPKWEEKYLIETTKEYPVSINGKLRTTINMDINAPQHMVEETVLANPTVQKWIEDKPVKKFIFVKGKMVNVVV